MPSVDQKEERPNINPTPEVFEVESILQRGNLEGKKYYLVKWKGYSEQQATWEPQSNLAGCTQAIRQFENIIKKIHQKNGILQSSQSSKKNKSKLQEKQREPSITQSKELSKANFDILKPSNKNLTKQKRPARQRRQTRETTTSKRISNIKELQQKETKNDISTKQKDQSHNQSKQSERSSESDILEATTAQTIPLTKQRDQFLKVDKIFQKNFEANLKKEKSSQFIDNTSNKESFSIKMINSSALKDKQHQRLNLKREREREREREKHESSEKQIQKIKKKYKKSPIEEISQTSLKQYKTQTFSNKKQIKQSINEVLQQSKSHERKQKQKLEKNQKSKIESNEKLQLENDEKLKLEKNLKQKLERIQILKLEKSSDLERDMKNSKEYKPEKHSLRFILCEEEFFDLTNEVLGHLDKRLKNSLNIEEDEGDGLHSKKLFPKFIDLSSVQFSSLNRNLVKILLNKEKVQKLDGDGEFLDCKIQAMIKISEQINGKKEKQWVCAMSSFQSQDKEKVLKDTRYFVRIDDLKRDSWKKQFRRFTLAEFQ